MSTDGAQWWIIDIVGPAVLVVALIWLVFQRRSAGKEARSEQATDDLYREEERRHREGTDDL